MSTAFINHLRRKQRASSLNSYYQRLSKKYAIVDPWEDIPEDFGVDSTDQMTGPKYHGKDNWETWNTILWIYNKEGLYRDMLATPSPYTADSAERFIRSRLPDGTPDMKSNKGYDVVNWQEVAEAFNEHVA